MKKPNIIPYTQLSVLGKIIEGGPMSAYDIFKSTGGENWKVTAYKNVHKCVKTLEKHGFIMGKRAGTRDRIEYNITGTGRSFYKLTKTYSDSLDRLFR